MEQINITQKELDVLIEQAVQQIEESYPTNTPFPVDNIRNVLNNIKQDITQVDMKKVRMCSPDELKAITEWLNVAQLQISRIIGLIQNKPRHTYPDIEDRF